MPRNDRRPRTLRTRDLPQFMNSFNQHGVGFESMVEKMLGQADNASSYPPYNIIKQNDNKFTIELAIAGFDMDEIDITLDRNTLVVEGKSRDDRTETDTEYLHRGISTRSFSRSWDLAEHIKVNDAQSRNGLLLITLEREIPEEFLPRKIEITSVD
jgi:molecular chaperone IbpA